MSQNSCEVGNTVCNLLLLCTPTEVSAYDKEGDVQPVEAQLKDRGLIMAEINCN